MLDAFFTEFMTVAAKDGNDSVCADFKVFAEADTVNIAEVVIYLLLNREVVAAKDLGKAGDAWADVVAMTLLGGHEFVIFWDPRAGADETHFAFDDIDELGELVKRGATDDFTNTGDFVLFVVIADVIFDGHTAELVESEGFAV